VARGTRSSRTGLLVGALLLVAVAVAAMVLVLDDSPSDNELVEGGEPGIGVHVQERPGTELPADVGRGGESRLEVDAVLPPEPADEPLATRSVAGRLRRLADDSPLAAAEVRTPQARDLTDERGSFRLDAVGAQERHLVVGISGQILHVELPQRPGDLSELELVVDTGWVLTGSVYSEQGGPVAGARVAAASKAPPVFTDSGGRFVLRDLEPADFRALSLKVTAEAPLHVSQSWMQTLDPRRRVLGPLEIRLSRGGALEGWVRDPSGRAAEGMLVGAVMELGQGRPTQANAEDALTDADGAYRLDGLTAGSYLIVVDGPRVVSSRYEDLLQVIVDLEDGAPTKKPQDPADRTSREWFWDVEIREGEVTRLDVRLLSAASLGGRVVDVVGNSLPGTELVVWRMADRLAPSSAPEGIRVIDGIEITTELRPDGSKRMRFLARLRTAKVEDDGRYQVQGLPPGALWVLVSDSGHPGWKSEERGLQLAAAEARAGEDFILGGGRVLRGRVILPAGEPAEGVLVSLTSGDGVRLVGSHGRLQTDVDGRFEFSGLGVGRMGVHLRLAGYRADLLSLEPTPLEQVLRLTPGGILEGRVLDVGTGEPVSGFRMEIESEAMVLTQNWQGDEGRFRWDTLDDTQEVSLRVIPDDPRYQPTTLTGLRPSRDGLSLDVHLQRRN
jgi:protocatechuate 3,4-dioxygenase beta subunit